MKKGSDHLNLHRANPMRSDITVVEETAARGARSASLNLGDLFPAFKARRTQSANIVAERYRAR